MMRYAPTRHQGLAKARDPEWPISPKAVSHYIPKDTQTIQAIANATGHPPETDVKGLLLKITHAMLCEHRTQKKASWLSPRNFITTCYPS